MNKILKSAWMFRARLGLATVLYEVLGLAMLAIWVMPKFAGGADSVGGGDTTTLAEMLKIYYLPGYNNQLQNATVLFDRLARNGVENAGGSRVQMFTVKGRHSGLGARGERGPTPVPGSTSGANPYSTTSKFFLSIAITSDLMDKSKSDQEAFARGLELELETAQDDGRTYLNQCLWGDRTGYRARVAGSPAAGVITIDNDGLVNTTTGARSVWLEVGWYVAAINSSTGEVRQNGMLITAIDKAANTITVSINGTTGAGATADNDYIVIGSQSGEGNDYNQGVSGITATLTESNNTYWNINRATAGNEYWRPQRYNATGITFDENTIRAVMDRIKKFGGQPNNQALEGKLEDIAILSSIEGVSKYAATMTGDKRYVNTTTLEGGWTAVVAHGKPLLEDLHCPLGRYYYFRWADWQLFSEIGMLGFRLEDTDGQTIRKIPGYDLYELLLKARLELGCKKPNCSGLMYNVDMTALT